MVLATLGYLTVAVVGAVATGNAEFVIYIGILVVLFGLLAALHRSVRLPTALLAALSVWGGLHMAGGLVPVPDSWPIDGDKAVLYSWYVLPLPFGGRLKYDQIVHAYGFGTTTWVVWVCLARSLAARGLAPRPTKGLLLIAAAAGCGFGALNEVIEFGATLVTETNVGGYLNTALDLVANLCGATIAAILIAVTDRRRERPEMAYGEDPATDRSPGV